MLGENVRYDGGHKRADVILSTLSRFFDWVPVCPEVEVGLGTPREPMRLIGNPDSPRVVTLNTNVDVTERLLDFAHTKVQELTRLNLNGYILKKNSPSCGLAHVPVCRESGTLNGTSRGIFARRLKEEMAFLPLEEESRLTDPELRENFVLRVFCYLRWQTLIQREVQIEHLTSFHARHKPVLRAHSGKHTQALERLVATARSPVERALLYDYAALFFEALSVA